MDVDVCSDLSSRDDDIVDSSVLLAAAADSDDGAPDVVAKCEGV